MIFAGKSNGTFVQCSNIKCSKWRFLPEFEDPAMVRASIAKDHIYETEKIKVLQEQEKENHRDQHWQVPSNWECRMNLDLSLNSCDKGKSEDWVESSEEMVSVQMCSNIGTLVKKVSLHCIFK